MAPVTRSSVYGRQHQAVLPRTSMDIDANEPNYSLNGEDEYDEIDDVAEQHDSPTFRSAQDMLLPLQETANRVSRQVEEFAKQLDRFKAERDPSDQELWTNAFKLLQDYARATKTRKSQTTNKGGSRVEDTQAQIRSLQLECNLWTLTETLLKCKCPEAAAAAKNSAKIGLQDLHRYSTNWDLWNTFLDSDAIAQEYECVLDWLQDSAAQQAPPLEEVVADLTQKSERGDGIWSAGLIYTKDAIKKQKRSRAWPMPLDPSNPGLSSTHIREDGERLVTQMDPDAPIREGAKLEQSDEYHEEAAWELCWEMLRRGMRIDEIRLWWADRNESWRAALLNGSNVENEEGVDTPWLRIINIASNPQWLARCQLMSKKQLGQNTYEKAVYGVLSGNHEVTVQACDDVEDIFFSYYNAILIQRFGDYLEAYERKLRDPQAINYNPSGSSFSVLRDFLASMENNDFVREELQGSHRFIESAIMCQDFENFFLQQGSAAAQIAHLTLDSIHLMENDSTTPQIEPAQYAAQDQDSVRIVAHLQLLLRELGFLNNAYKLHPYRMDNNIVNYIGILERESKFSLLPLYASKLTTERTAHVLGTILIKVTDPHEQEQIVKLMKDYAIDLPLVLFGIFQLANYNEIQELKSIKDAQFTARITEYLGTSNVRHVKIKSNFMGEPIAPGSDEEKSIRSVQWTRYMDAANWEMATLAVSSVYKYFLLTGKLSAARELVEHVRLSSTSLSAVGMNLNLAVIAEDGSQNGDIDMDGSVGSIDHPLQPISPSRKRKESRTGNIQALTKAISSREELAATSRVWAQLEQLVEAMISLDTWQELATEIEGSRGDVRQMRQFKHALQEALNNLQAAMAPFFDYEFLTLPTDEEESVHLAIIRNHYIPEMILGYNSALYFAGHSLSRKYLIQCMNLAQEVAQNDMLTNAFVEGGRMRELVSAFALDSQALLRANEVGSKPSAAKKGKRESIGVEGKGDIWQIVWKSDAEQEGDVATR